MISGGKLSKILTERWLWIIIFSLILILLTPLLVVWVILNLPPTLRIVATSVIIIAWGIAAGYKDLVTEKRARKKEV